MTVSRDESGIAVYPRLPVPAAGLRGEREQMPPRMGKRRSRRGPLIAIIAALGGGAAAWFLHPVIAPDARIGQSSQRAADADKAASAQKTRADALEKSLDAASTAKRDAEAKLAVAEAAQSELASKTADEANQHAQLTFIAAKLKAATDKSADFLVMDGEVHVRFADHLLFKPADDALTDHGKAILGRLGAALKQLPDQQDRQIWVQGHTDEQSPPARPAPPAKHGKPAPPPPAAPKFTSPWELSAARAVAVVHYFQDVAKLDPTRLAALAFGPYDPIAPAAKDRAANRRLEIVVRPHRSAK